MKVTYITRNKRMKVEFDVNTQIQLWAELARFQEVFEDTTCKKDGQESDDVRFVVRNVTKDGKNYKYYELRCMEQGPLRGVRKAFSCHEEGGGLYFKNKNSEGEYLPDNGWLRWDQKAKKEV